MVASDTWNKLASIAKEHATYSLRSFRRAVISRETNVAIDLGLQGELAVDFLEDVERTFPDFSFSGEKGDFSFDTYFLSQISQTFLGSWLYLIYPRARRLDESEKLPLTLGMLEDAISRGYWDTARYH
jgi:Protein of unknown function (DUF1493)